MKHTRVPRTIRKEVRRLAIEHLRYLALTLFEAESGIISQVESKTGKKRNGPNRKSNRLTNKKNPHTLVVSLLLGLTVVVQGLR